LASGCGNEWPQAVDKIGEGRRVQLLLPIAEGLRGMRMHLD
jgi:hypothetical protein